MMGDAAHAACPVGSSGAGAGIIDARKLVAEHAANYKRIAGFGIQETNNKPRTIADGARFDVLAHSTKSH